MPSRDIQVRREVNRRWYRNNRAKKIADVAAEKRAKRERNRAYLRQIKNTTPCADCGRYFPAVAMDFDHVAPGKTYCISALMNRGAPISRLDAEIALCEIVCACCHRVRTAKRLIEGATVEGDASVVQWEDVTLPV